MVKQSNHRNFLSNQFAHIWKTLYTCMIKNKKKNTDYILVIPARKKISNTLLLIYIIIIKYTYLFVFSFNLAGRKPLQFKY